MTAPFTDTVETSVTGRLSVSAWDYANQSKLTTHIECSAAQAGYIACRWQVLGSKYQSLGALVEIVEEADLDADPINDIIKDHKRMNTIRDGSPIFIDFDLRIQTVITQTTRVDLV